MRPSSPFTVRQELAFHRDAHAVAFWAGHFLHIHRKVNGAHDAVRSKLDLAESLLYSKPSIQSTSSKVSTCSHAPLVESESRKKTHVDDIDPGGILHSWLVFLPARDNGCDPVCRADLRLGSDSVVCLDQAEAAGPRGSCCQA